jgi:hypothetical protein
MIRITTKTGLDTAIRHSEFTLQRSIAGEDLQDLIESIADIYNKEIEEIQAEHEESAEKFKDDNQDYLDNYLSEISDRTVDVIENIKAIKDSLESFDIPHGVVEYLDKIQDELMRLETNLTFELD